MNSIRYMNNIVYKDVRESIMDSLKESVFGSVSNSVWWSVMNPVRGLLEDLVKDHARASARDYFKIKQ